MSRTILPIFSSRTFIISDLTFSSFVWVYFLHGIKTYSNLILLHVVCNYNFSNYIIHLCLLIIYLFYVLGSCINCVNCFLHFSILFSSLQNIIIIIILNYLSDRLLISSLFIWPYGQGCVRWRILECLWDSCLLMIAFVFCLASCLGKVSWSGSCQQLGDNRVCVQVSKFSVTNSPWG